MKKQPPPAKKPFRFYTRLHLTELLGLKAANLVELIHLVKEVPGGSIYHHTHRFLQQHLFLNPEPPNDFAYWVTEVLGEERLGELLASIDTIQFNNIRALREKILSVLETYLAQNPRAAFKFADDGEEFHMMKSMSFILPTRYEAKNLKEFVEALQHVTIDSIYYHVFEARLRLELPTNDFSEWIEDSLGDRAMGQLITRLDPYTQTLEGLRQSILRIVSKGIC